MVDKLCKGRSDFKTLDEYNAYLEGRIDAFAIAINQLNRDKGKLRKF